MTRRRILFVDIDGVLHPYPPHSGLQRMCWVPDLAALVLPRADVYVVVHSSWRYDYPVEHLRSLLGGLGPRLLGVTPAGQRYEAIKTYLAQSDNVADFRILDDMTDEFPRQPAPSELILCDGRTGISAPGVRAMLRAWLNSVVRPQGGD